MLRQAFFNMPGLSKNEHVILMQYLDEYPKDSNLNTVLNMIRSRNHLIYVKAKYSHLSVNDLSNMIVEQVDNLNAVQDNGVNLTSVGVSENGIVYGRRR